MFKKEECNMDGKCNGASEGKECYIFHSPLNVNGINSRKRVKLQGKLSDDRCPMNTPFVPKRLRSAFNKRVNQSVSSNGTQLSNSFSAERGKQNMLNSVTKDEEEVAETLTSMANLITVTKTVETEEDRKKLEENLEAPKEEDTKFLVPCNPSPCVEEKQMVITKKFDAEDNVPSLPNSLKKFSSDAEPLEGVEPSRDAMKLSYPLGTSLQYFPINGMFKPTQLDSLLVQRQELGPTSMKHELQSFEQKPDYVAHDVCGEASNGQHGLHRRIHEQLTTPSSSKAVRNPTSCFTVSGGPCSTNGLPIEKLSLTSADKKWPWKKCITHVYITCLVQNHQKTSKRRLIVPQCNQSIPSEGTTHAVPVSSGSVPEARNWKLQDERLVQAPKGLNVMKSVGKLHVHSPPHQAATPFTVPRGCCTSQYHEKSAAGTTQQLPMYIAGGELWQAQFAHYMQNGRQHNSSSSPPPIFPLDGDYNLHNLHQPFVLPVHSSSSSLFFQIKAKTNYCREF